VDEAGILVFINLAARRMLDVAAEDLGRPFADLAVSYRPVELRSRIEEAQLLGRAIRLEHQPHHRPPAEPQRLSIEITPMAERDGAPARHADLLHDTSRLFAMQRELEAAQESLSTTVEELQSANEELETTNEELQSTNEELETTNEELQSTNEELETMNEELRSTNDELELVNEALRTQEEHNNDYRRRTNSLLASVDAGLVTLDRRLRVEHWNRWCEDAWGLRAEEVLGQDLLGLDIGLPLHDLRDDLLRILAGEAPSAEVTLDARDRRGRAVSCRVRTSPMGRPPGGLILVMEDATEAQREGEYTRYLGRVLGQALSEVYFLDPQTLRFVLINRGAERKLGYAIEQLRQLPITALMPGIQPAAVHALLAPLLRGDQPEVVFEAVMRTRDGREYPAEFCIQHMLEEQPPILVAMVHDISERRRLAQDAAAS
jgi:two-component system CheB/CheR fusion protein